MPAVMICRLKIYQTILSFSFSFYLSYLYFLNEIEKKTLMFGFGVSLFAVTMLFIAGNVFKKMIGFVYLNHDNSLIKLAHLSFWGKRIDTIYKLNNVVPLSDSNNFNIDKAMFAKIKFYDSQDEYYINLRFGEVTKSESFRKIFGYYR